MDKRMLFYLVLFGFVFASIIGISFANEDTSTRNNSDDTTTTQINNQSEENKQDIIVKKRKKAPWYAVVIPIVLVIPLSLLAFKHRKLLCLYLANYYGQANMFNPGKYKQYSHPEEIALV